MVGIKGGLRLELNDTSGSASSCKMATENSSLNTLVMEIYSWQISPHAACLLAGLRPSGWAHWPEFSPLFSGFTRFRSQQIVALQCASIGVMLIYTLMCCILVY